MEYLPYLMDAFLVCICIFLGRKAGALEARLDILRATVDYLEKRVGDAIDLAAESRREAERTEKKFFEGVSNIMNYDLSQARKGAGNGD